ncbi:S-layer homology domain-containing protein [Paenibacillus thermoaerophilus]|uniref:S-layer homology domain-containing protein n=1 Tax=Paenibacillus thermoaerophilus TaxID=1215385 RepID=A0ABW2V2Y1_9BACL|nr:S-layer homology domain-containing protein [Paenibacillus thermoaerophilus]TMV17429.1 hypothetical protein FE781_06770 [Paenibacillus thermoaerophilus]
MNWKKALTGVLAAVLAVPALTPAPAAHADDIVEYEPIAIPNAGFEESASQAVGWEVQVPIPPAGDDGWVTRAVVSQDRAFEGSNSLLMTDHSPKKGLYVYSAPIPVTGGETYRLTAQIYVTSKSVQNYIKFYDAAGKEVGTKNVLSNTLNTWNQLQFEHTAPSNAVTAKILFNMGPTTSGTVAYIDQVEFHHKKVTVIAPLELPYEAAPVVIGDAVRYVLSQSAAYGVGPDGRPEQYLTTSGTPAAFHAVDAVTGELLFTQNLPFGDTIWALTTAPDGNVYFATTTNGHLYKFDVLRRELKDLGANPSNVHVFDLKASADGKLYGSTYNNAGRFGRVFEYDIASGEFKDLGVWKDGEQYVRGLGVTDQYVYGGIGTKAHLMRYDRNTGEIVELNIPEVSGESGTLSEIVIAGGKLFVHAGTKVHVLNETTGEYIREFEFQSKLSPPSPHNPNLIYYKLKGELYTYDLQTDITAKVEGVPELPDDTAIKAHAWITPTSGPFAGRTVLAGMAAFGESFLYDPLTGEYEEHLADVPPAPTQVQSLEAKGNYLHIGGYQRGMSIYDVSKGEFIYSNHAFHQPEGIGFLNDIVYYGTYSGARMYRLDMSKPIDYKELEWSNLGLAADLEDDQDRPFAMTSGDGKLFIGTFPTYGKLGGALTVLEETRGPDGEVSGVTYEMYRNLVPNQSIMGLAYKDGVVYGGTSRVGGLGIDPTEPEAMMFAFDVATKQLKIQPFVPALPGAKGPVNMIGELSIGPDGLLWGIADTTIYKADGSGAIDKYDAILFAMNPADMSIVKSKVVTQSAFSTSKYRPYYIRWGADGLMYTTIGRQLYAVDPTDLRTKPIIPGTVNLMTLGPDGSIYYANGGKLLKLPVKIRSSQLRLETPSIPVGGTSLLLPEIELANGLKASLGGATIAYASSDESVAVVENGAVRGIAPGTASITATITLDGRTVTTPPVEVNVIGNWFAETKFAYDGTLSGIIQFPAEQTGHSVTLSVYGEASADPIAASAVSTVTYSTYADNLYGYAFSFKLDSPAERVRIVANVDGQPYSDSGWIEREPSAETPPVDPETPPVDPETPPVDPVTPPVTPPVTDAFEIDPSKPDAPVDAKLLLEALDKFQHVTVKTKSSARLPLSALEQAGDAAVLTVETDTGSYVLEPSRLPVTDWAAQLGVTAQSLNLRVTIDTASAEIPRGRIRELADEKGAGLLSEVHEFRLTVETGDGRTFEVKDFGGVYVERTIRLPDGFSAADGRIAIVATYDAESDSLRYVPGVVSGGTATFFRTGNSAYVVLSSKPGSFGDTASHWAEDAIARMSARLIVNGAAPGKFEPERGISRAELAALLNRSLGLSAGAASASFTDVRAGEWHAGEIASAAGAGLIDGYEDGSFQPDRQVTRAEAAAMSVRALRFAGVPLDAPAGADAAETLKPYRDANDVPWARDELAAAVRSGLLQGQSADTLAPNAPITRAEAAVLVERLLLTAGFGQ